MEARTFTYSSLRLDLYKNPFSIDKSEKYNDVDFITLEKQVSSEIENATIYDVQPIYS